ncbi:MAG: hypothetical protein ACI8RZ_004173 [Myxococcota bacterium]|jgi:hypothetical protein
MLWLIETDVFDDTYKVRMSAAIRSTGHTLRLWDDAWWDDGLPRVRGPVMFHGSLGNAAAIKARCPSWAPGALCDVNAFRCSTWYPRADRWLLHARHRTLPAQQLVADAAAVYRSVGAGDAAFVRPDSPLKPFSGRVISASAMSLSALDHGIYWEDDQLPVVVAPLRDIGREWRFVIVNRQVVTGSGYIAEGRQADAAEPTGAPWRLAAEIAAHIAPPEPAYVLDVCEADGALHLLELGPLSGADLYGCDLSAVVSAVSDMFES